MLKKQIFSISQFLLGQPRQPQLATKLNIEITLNLLKIVTFQFSNTVS